MRAPWDKPWHVEGIDPAIVERLASKHEPYPKVVAMGVDIYGDPHAQDNDGYSHQLGRSPESDRSLPATTAGSTPDREWPEWPDAKAGALVTV
jgi:hypothetical protein